MRRWSNYEPASRPPRDAHLLVCLNLALPSLLSCERFLVFRNPPGSGSLLQQLEKTKTQSSNPSFFCTSGSQIAPGIKFTRKTGSIKTTLGPTPGVSHVVGLNGGHAPLFSAAATGGPGNTFENHCSLLSP